LWGGPSPAQAQARPRILFYHRNDPYYGFTNFSPHPVQYNGKEYPTSEHLFQAFKVCQLFFFTKEYLRRNQFLDNRPDIAEKIRTISNSPRDAFNEARAHKADQHPDWLKMKMNIAKVGR
jgi:diaminohydroxyphosphoribosylaminopyrimidine deaminase/5-amino-6-(5-phosphoribosylamino)uracil reductase